MTFSPRYPRVYFASKLSSAKIAHQLREAWPNIHFTARWPLMAGVVPDDERFAGQFWQDDFDDIWRADLVLVWAEPNDHLRGALVEAGIGLALNKLVVLAGEHPDFGTWQFHPSVRRKESLPAALDFCSQFTPRFRP